MRNNPQQGGYFSRYAGMGMSPVPAGYMESAAQEAAMYSNMGSTIANMYMKKQEMGIKGQEIAAEKESTAAKVKANELTGARIDAGDRKLEFDAWKAEQDLGLKADEQKFKTFTDADKILENRYSTLNLKLSKATTQEEKDRITQEMNGISEQRGVISQGVSRYLKDGTFSDQPKTPAPSVRTKRGAVNQEYTDYLKYNSTGVPLLRRQEYIDAGVPRLSKRNPNEASEPTNGGSGAVITGLEHLLPSGIPTATKAYLAADVAPAPTVVDGRPATVVAGKPDIFMGHFDTEIKRSTSITNSANESLVGQFEFTPNENRALPGVISLTVNDTLLSKDNKELSEANRVQNERTFREMHVLKFILENSFDFGVQPTKEQALLANKKFNADKSPIIGRIQSAYALLANDEAGVNNEVNLRFNKAFKQRFRMSVDRFMLDGSLPDVAVSARQTSAIPKMIDERNKILLDISNATTEELPATYQKDPTEDQRTALLKQIKEDNDLFLQQSPGVDTDAYKILTDRISRARAEHDSLVKESDAWRHSREVWVTQNKFGSDALRGKLTNLNATIDAMQSTDKFMSESAKSFGLGSRTWLGARPEDEKVLSGWLARGIVNFPKTVVTDAKGRSIVVNPSEYLDWVVSTRSYSDFDEVNSAVGAPTQKDFDEALATNAEHQKLIPPLNALITEWKNTGKKDLPQSIIDKFLNPQTAAQENNVFAIMAAQRKPVTGGGNPSNFEQQMLLSGIPNPGTVFTFADFSLYRLKTTAVLSMLSHARMMQNHGFAITEEALNSYNLQYSKIFGRKITMADFNKYQRFVNDRKGAYEGRAGAMTTEDAAAMGKAGFDELTSLITTDFK